MADATLSSAVSEVIKPLNQYVINPLIALAFAVAAIVFLWGVVQFLMNGDSEEGRRKGIQHIIWGAVGIGIMLSAFGIINLILNTINDPQHGIQSRDRPTTLPQ